MIKTILTATLLFAGAPALAQDDSNRGASIHVGYADLNLASPAGRAALDRRIDHAVSKLCPDAKGPSVREHSASATCRTIARASAASQRTAAIARAGQDSATRLASATR